MIKFDVVIAEHLFNLNMGIPNTCTSRDMMQLVFRYCVMWYSHWPEKGLGTNALYKTMWKLSHYT